MQIDINPIVHGVEVPGIHITLDESTIEKFLNDVEAVKAMIPKPDFLTQYYTTEIELDNFIGDRIFYFEANMEAKGDSPRIQVIGLYREEFCTEDDHELTEEESQMWERVRVLEFKRVQKPHIDLEEPQEPKNRTEGVTILWNDNKDHAFGGDEYAAIVLPNGKCHHVKIIGLNGEAYKSPVTMAPFDQLPPKTQEIVRRVRAMTPEQRERKAQIMKRLNETYIEGAVQSEAHGKAVEELAELMSEVAGTTPFKAVN